MLAEGKDEEQDAERKEEHRRLLRILLSHELLQRKFAPFEWRDNFCKETLQILAQHAVQVRAQILLCPGTYLRKMLGSKIFFFPCREMHMIII